tara:strand:+ start:24 stop:281 length:258 start_codon:yes stop_codon:yes gene_type:complete
MASIRVDYTLILENPTSERKGKMFVPIDLDCSKEELMEYINDAIMDTCDDFDEVVSGEAIVHYFGVTFDMQFYIEEDEECQTTIH